MFKNFHLLFFAVLSFSLYAQVAPGDPNAVPVEFRFTHQLAATDSGVGVNGSMNNWLNGVFRMRETSPNLYKVTLDLLSLNYEYKFVTFTDTVGQAGVTGYFTDPLNPRVSGPFNNSVMAVKSPMIYYLLPKPGASITEKRPHITANVSWANNRQIDPASFELKIDNVDIPNASNYFNVNERFFSYLPANPFTTGSHTVWLKCSLTNGDTVSLTSTFTVIEDNSSKPYTFTFDSKSPGFNFLSPVTRVDIKGSFNQNGQTPMTDPDGDGIFAHTTNLIINEPNEYTIIVNTGSYINDPDNPLLSNNHRTVAVRKKNPYPYFTEISPQPGEWYLYPDSTTLTITGKILKGDSVMTVNNSSVRALFQGSPLTLTLSPVTDGFSFRTSVPIFGPGRYVVEFQGKDIYGNSARSFFYHFGVRTAAGTNGFVYYDGENDDRGNGNYFLPPTVDTGIVDLRSVKITSSQNRDSLWFEVEMEKIHDYTRVGFMISHDLTSAPAELPFDVKLRIPDWKNKGVLIVLAKPASQFIDTTWENRLLLSRDPITLSLKPLIELTGAGGNTFRFSLPLEVLRPILGSYNTDWYFHAWTYLRGPSGTIKVSPLMGGDDFPEATNVFDIGFISSSARQEILLKNYRSSSQTGGSQLALIGKPERGAARVNPVVIHPLLGQTPLIDLYATGGVLYTDSVTIWGKAYVPAGTVITIKNLANTYTAVTGSDNLFSKRIPLQEGVNSIHAEYLSPNGLSQSSNIIYTYEKDKRPVVKVRASAAGGTVTLSADSSYSPGGGPLFYQWLQSPKNPVQVSMSSSISPTVTFPSPGVSGEYYFTVAITNNIQQVSYASTVITVAGGIASVPDYATWHPAWLDTSIIYSIFVRTFDQSGTFTGIKNRMLELKDLGVDVLWLLPIHPTTGNLGPDNPGYATTNYMDVLPQYGTKEEFRQMVETAHSYGIKVILDHVIQHTSDLHPFMKDANRYKQYSPYYPFYMWDANGNFQYLFTWVDLPSINYSSKNTRDYLLKVAKYWVHDFGVDGFRCDVAWAINDLRPEGPAYWQNWRRELKGIKPDLFLMAEADARFERYFDAKFDVAYDWNLFTAIRSLVSGTTTIAAVDSSVRYFLNPQFPQHARPYRFLENQDEQRFIEAYGISKTKLAATFLFSVPGIPSLYAGQEVGEMTFRGNIQWNDPLSMRPFYKKLISVRRSTPALFAGDYRVVPNSKPNEVYTVLRRKGNSNVIMNFNFSNSAQTVNIQVPIELLAFDSTAQFYLNDEINRISYQVTGTQLRNFQLNVPGNFAQIFILSNEPLTEIKEDIEIRPESFAITQNYPNPFNPSTSFRYSLPSGSHVNVSVYNMLGEKIDELVNASLGAGIYEAVWNGGKFASGVYFITIEAKPVNGGEAFRSTRKMLMIK